MKRCLWALTLAVTMLLVGCASPKVQSDVTVFQEWPTDLQGQTVAFDRTTDQENNLEYRAYENLVRNELHRLGFVDAPTPQAAKIKAAMAYSVSARDIRIIEPVVVDPFWPGPAFYGPRWRSYYGPFYDPFWYGPPAIEYREKNFELFKRQLRITLSRAANGKKLYDVTVDSEGRNGSLAAVMPYMVRSAFMDFPGKNGVSHRIELEMKNHGTP